MHFWNIGLILQDEFCQEKALLPFEDGDYSVSSCGVCLCPVDTSEGALEGFLDYGGKLYHCKCANFWVNEVDVILPSLSSVYLSPTTIATSSSATNANSYSIDCITNEKYEKSTNNRVIW